MQEIHPLALFRLSVLGPLLSRERFEHGELKRLIGEQAARAYDIPGSSRSQVSAKAIEAWYYAYRREGLDALEPKARADRGRSKIPPEIQAAILAAKRANPRRSIRAIRRLLEQAGTVAAGELSRSAIHRLLAAHGLSRPTGAASLPEEYRSFEAERAGDIWYGDVMHGPSLPIRGRQRKLYLVSLMDDASRLIAHSAFCLGETALDVEGVLKQAVLKRGLPKKLVLDNGAAYRAKSLQGICARLGIRLVYCRPYAPEGKGKLERWHRTLRNGFLGEVDLARIRDLGDLNARLWAWIEVLYHHAPHSGLDGNTPLARYQRDLVQVRPLGPLATRLDALFHHRLPRRVRKDGTVAYRGERFEVPYELAGQSVVLVVDPHAGRVVGVEDGEGNPLGAATALDAIANAQRKRRKPTPGGEGSPPAAQASDAPNAVELAYRQYHGLPLETSEEHTP
jgi:putative transposase